MALRNCASKIIPEPKPYREQYYSKPITFDPSSFPLILNSSSSQPCFKVHLPPLKRIKMGLSGWNYNDASNDQSYSKTQKIPRKSTFLSIFPSRCSLFSRPVNGIYDKEREEPNKLYNKRRSNISVHREAMIRLNKLRS